jgi:hypothetical protein
MKKNVLAERGQIHVIVQVDMGSAWNEVEFLKFGGSLNSRHV